MARKLAKAAPLEDLGILSPEMPVDWMPGHAPTNGTEKPLEKAVELGRYRYRQAMTVENFRVKPGRVAGIRLHDDVTILASKYHPLFHSANEDLRDHWQGRARWMPFGRLVRAEMAGHPMTLAMSVVRQLTPKERDWLARHDTGGDVSQVTDLTDTTEAVLALRGRDRAMLSLRVKGLWFHAGDWRGRIDICGELEGTIPIDERPRPKLSEMVE